MASRFMLVCALLVPAVAAADQDINKVASPPKTAPFVAITPVEEYWPDNGDPSSSYGYGNLSGRLLYADERADRFSELARATLIEKCFRSSKDGTAALMEWTLCGTDVKSLDLKKLQAEMVAGGISAASQAETLAHVTKYYEQAKKIGAAIEEAAKTDKGIQQVLAVADAAKAEWMVYIGAHKADFDRYLALKDGVRSGKTNNPVFAGCYEATQPPFAKLVKATAPKIPWDVKGDQLPGYTHFMIATIEGYITTVSYAACAWSIHTSGEAMYVAAANQEFGGDLKAGFRTLTLGKLLDEKLKPKFADRSIQFNQSYPTWTHGVAMSGVNDITAMMTPKDGVIGKLTKKDDEETTVSFKGDKVEKCLQWKETNKVTGVSAGGSVQYDHVCLKRGLVANETGAVEIATKFAAGIKAGDSITIIYQFPAVAWKGKKLTALLGIALK